MRKNIEIKIRSKEFITTEKRVNRVLENINLNFQSGHLTSIIGSSGCGKSTLLKLISGLDTDYDGEVLIDGSVNNSPSLKVGFVFQDHRLLPWLTAKENIELSLHKIEGRKRSQRVKESLEIVGLLDYENAYPRQLSGGMAQRIAIARAIAHEPEIILMDEPFGALDAITRMHLQDELNSIQNKLGATIILVTHDIDEAVYLSNRIVGLHSNPSAVTIDQEIDLPFPRNRGDIAFMQYKADIYKNFHSNQSFFKGRP